MSRRIRALQVACCCLVAASAVAATEITFSPAPPVAGQPFTITFHGVDFGCGDAGTLQLLSTGPKRLTLRVQPPGCIIIPIGPIEYTASVTVGPLSAGTYSVEVGLQAGGQGSLVLLDQQWIEVKEPPVCNATATSLCLGDGRFQVTGTWRDFAGNQGLARAAPDDFDGLGGWGVLWFFAADNPEMLVKVLDGCAVNEHFWVFLSPASTVEYRIVVRDVLAGEEKTYSNALSQVPELTADTDAFPCLANGGWQLSG